MSILKRNFNMLKETDIQSRKKAIQSIDAWIEKEVPTLAPCKNYPTQKKKKKKKLINLIIFHSNRAIIASKFP